MKVINISENKKIAKEKFIYEIVKDLRAATNFIIITSDDNLNMVYDRYFNLTTVEVIGVLDVVKHKSLHEVFPDDYDGNKEDIPAEGGM